MPIDRVDRVALVDAVEQLTVEYDGSVPAGTVARYAQRCLERLVETGIEPSALPPALFAMTRALLERDLHVSTAAAAAR